MVRTAWPGPRGPLFRKSLAVNLPPKALAVLWELVTHAGQVVTKEELLATVWAGTVVGEETLTAFIGILRQALRDEAAQPRYITTVHRVGYRFIGKVVSSQHSVVSKWSVKSKGQSWPSVPKLSQAASTRNLQLLSSEEKPNSQRFTTYLLKC